MCAAAGNKQIEKFIQGQGALPEKALKNAYENTRWNYLKNLPLDEEHQAQLESRLKKNKEELREKNLEKSKELIKNYLKCGHNNGKKCLQIIFGTFDPRKDKKIPLIENNDKNICRLRI